MREPTAKLTNSYEQENIFILFSLYASSPHDNVIMIFSLYKVGEKKSFENQIWGTHGGNKGPNVAILVTEENI